MFTPSTHEAVESLQTRIRPHDAPAALSRLLVPLALLLILFAPAASGLQRDFDVRVGMLLAQQSELDDEKQQTSWLAGLGASALPALFDCLRDGTYWVTTNEEVGQVPLSAGQIDSVLRTIKRMSPASQRSFLHTRTADEPTPGNRRTALRLMVSIARKSDLTFCMQLAEPLAEDVRVDFEAADHLQLCLEKMLSESESVFGNMRIVFERAHLHLRPTIVRAVTSVGTDSGLQAMSEFLDRTEHLQLFILSSMGRVAGSATLPVDELIATRVRRMERSEDTALVCEALILLGRFEDAESVPRLIDRLSDKNRTVRAAAHWSLKHLSGLALRENPVRWEMWHKAEADWWKNDAPEVLGWLRSFDPQDRKRALAVISQRRQRKQELARELHPLLSDSDETVVTLTVRALSILDSRSSAPKVQELLEHHSQTVRESAAAALARW